MEKVKAWAAERDVIVYLHEEKKLSFGQIAKQEMFRGVSRQAIQKRYQAAKKKST